MGKILCCWELGEDYGHIGQFFPVIKALVARGHEVFFAVKDLSKIGDFAWPSGVVIVQAPIWLEKPKKPVRAECFAEIIQCKGYDTATHLKSLVTAWQFLFAAIVPDLLIIDHAPSALMASRGLNIPRIIFGNPFLSPPPGSPPINIRPWQQVDPARLNHIDSQVTCVINHVCMELNLPVVAQVSDLFSVDHIMLTGFYELDFYRDLRSSVIYGGTLPPSDGLQSPVWIPGMSIKVFAYLKFGREQVEPVLRHLAAMQVRVVCFYSGARPEDLERYAGSSIVVSNQPFDVGKVYRDAHAIICHAGFGMVTKSLHHGKPMLLLPTQIEQQNTAIRLKEMGVASAIQKEDSALAVEEKIKAFFNNSSLKENARIYSEKIKASTKGDLVQTLIDTCESMINRI
jgi:UDP-N-acetylglucosamine transferase subunit ALG13